MPTLFRFLMVLGVIGGVIAGKPLCARRIFSARAQGNLQGFAQRQGPDRGDDGSTPRADAGDALLLLLLRRQRRPQDVERSDLPPLPGAAAPDLDQARPPRRLSRAFPRRLPLPHRRAGRRSEASPLPYDAVARGRCGRARATARCGPRCRPPSPALAHADRARAGDRRSGERTGASRAHRRLAACRARGRGGRAARPRRGGQRPRRSRPLRAGTFGIGREDDACEVRLGGARRAAGGACSSRSIVPRREGDLRGSEACASARARRRRAGGRWPPPRSPA